ncbi:MAG: sigma 54-interacting transcriptional regulator [bacterium]
MYTDSINSQEPCKILIINQQADAAQSIKQSYAGIGLHFSEPCLSDYDLNVLCGLLHEDPHIRILLVKAFDNSGRALGLELLGHLYASTFWDDFEARLQLVLQMDQNVSLRKWVQRIPFVWGVVSEDPAHIEEDRKKLKHIVESRPDSAYIHLNSKLSKGLVFTESSIIKHETIVDLEVLSRIDGPIMISGDTGTGKEILARYLHIYTWHQILGNRIFEDRRLKAAVEALFISYDLSGGRDQGNLAYHDLFGDNRDNLLGGEEKGLFVLANEISDHLNYPSQVTDLPEEYVSGIRPLTDYMGMIPRVPFLVTIFLHEVGDMPARLQTVLFRVFREKKLEKFGLEWETGQFLNKVRVITTTNKKLQYASWRTEQDFSQKLYHLMMKVSLKTPSLKERIPDLLLLLCSAIEKVGKRYDDLFWFDWDPKTIKILSEYDWPGNIRELEEVVGRSYIYTKKINKRMELRGEPVSSKLLFPPKLIERLSRPRTQQIPPPVKPFPAVAEKPVAVPSVPAQPPAAPRPVASIHKEESLYRQTDNFMEELRELEAVTNQGLPEEEVKRLVKELILKYCTRINTRYHHEIIQRFGVIALARICRVLYRIRNYWPTDSVYEKEIFEAGESSIKSLLTRSGISFKQLENPGFKVHVRNTKRD